MARSSILPPAALAAFLLLAAAPAAAEVPRARVVAPPADLTQPGVLAAYRAEEDRAYVAQRQLRRAGLVLTIVGGSLSFLGSMLVAELRDHKPGDGDGGWLPPIGGGMLGGGIVLLACGVPMLVAGAVGMDRVQQRSRVPDVAFGGRSLALRWSF
jgi:hypothetical protein